MRQDLLLFAAIYDSLLYYIDVGQKQKIGSAYIVMRQTRMYIIF